MNIIEYHKSTRYLLIIIAVALLLRLATAIWLGDKMEVLPAGGTHDQVSYDMLAYRIATGHGFTFPTAWYPWIKPDTPTAYYSGTMVLHLAAIYYLFGYHPIIPRILYAILGTIICLLVYKLGTRLFGKKAGLIAGALSGGYAYLILYSATLLTETPFILFLLLSLDAAYELVKHVKIKNLIILGLALAAAILFRMAVLPFAALLLLWVLIESRARHKNSQDSKQCLKVSQLLLPVVIIIVAVLPWTIRNYLLFDRFMLLESQFGHVFWNANHPDQGYTFNEVAWVAPIPEELSHLNEADLTYTLLHRGIQNVLENPLRFVSLTLSRVRIFFMFWPTSDSSLMSNLGRVLSFGICLPFMIYGLALSFRSWQKCLPLYLFLFICFGVYLSSWVMIRYRIPTDTVLIIFAGLGLSDLHTRLRNLMKSGQNKTAIQSERIERRFSCAF